MSVANWLRIWAFMWLLLMILLYAASTKQMHLIINQHLLVQGTAELFEWWD